MKNTTVTLAMFCILIGMQVSVAQQTILTDSNLPIVIITTDINPVTGLPYEIVNDPKVPATLKLIFRPDGTRNYLADSNNTAYLNYNGRIGIELRGFSSQTLPKKAYGFTTRTDDNSSNNNVGLLNMPSEHDWVLNSLAFDPSMIRDYLSYNLAAEMGNYAPRVKYAEVIINDDYKGVYLLTEKIKIDPDRVNLVKLTESDNTSPNVTGGYIVKADKAATGEVVAWNMAGYTTITDFFHVNPKAEDITARQNTYIQSFFFDLEAKTNPANASVIDGYPALIDIPSFVDYFIMAEFTSNVDAYQLSTYFHKDRNGKLRAGPVWDYNLTFGNDIFDWGFNRSFYYVWQFDNGDNTGARFWKDLFNDATFKCYLAKRWVELTATDKPLNQSTVSSKMDQYVSLLTESQVREQIRWGTVASQAENVAGMKTWIGNRISWINSHVGSAENCSNIELPDLVISKIHYNPQASEGESGDDLEFIEITNHSDQNVEVTGYYIRELGISFQFPANSAIAPGQKIYLCSNTTAFTRFYGISPFGEFTRNLSNGSYNIVIADAFGNTIDEVRYLDESPWPEAADGTGPYLQLIDLSSDNSQAMNWTTSTARLLSAEGSLVSDKSVLIYPNPTDGVVNISIKKPDNKGLDLTIYNLYGQSTCDERINGENFQVDISGEKSGIYFFCIRSDEGTLYRGKIIRK